MLTIRPAAERGHTNVGWLDSRHTFSFNTYYDPAHMGFRSLRVINDDRVSAGAGFGTHAHRDMEILTWVLEGAIAHKDSLGTGSTIRPGEMQRMTAGSGITHSEFNYSATDPLHFLQIWIVPGQKNLEPGYEQREFPIRERTGQLRLVASLDGHDESVKIHQDVDVFVGSLANGNNVTHDLRPGRHAWIQVARGSATLNGLEMQIGDGARISAEDRLKISATSEAEILLFDLA